VITDRMYLERTLAILATGLCEKSYDASVSGRDDDRDYREARKNHLHRVAIEASNLYEQISHEADELMATSQPKKIPGKLKRPWIVHCDKCGETKVTQTLMDQLEYENYGPDEGSACMCPVCGGPAHPSWIMEK